MAPWSLRSRANSNASTPAEADSKTATPVRQSARGNGGPSNRPHLFDANSKTSTSSTGGRMKPPLSPTLSARSVGTNATGVTRASKMEWSEQAKGPDVIITRADMRNSLDTYERLLSAAKAYRNAMLALASATSNFASALEDCARQKGAAHTPAPRASTSTQQHNTSTLLDDEEEVRSNDDVPEQDLTGEEESITSAGEKLMAAAGLHHVMSNQQQLLSDTFYKSFEIPLLEKFDDYKQEVQDRQLTYEKETGEKSRKIRDTEAENMRMGRKKQRDLASFRRALVTLQSQVDDLDRIKVDFYYEVLAGEQETWSFLSSKVALVVRSQIDSADRIVTKGSSDSVIEDMVQHILDPFNAYGPANGEEGHIFSILPPLSIASPANSAEQSPNHPSSGLARTRTNLSGSTVTQASLNEASPASTARWAEEQKKRAANNNTLVKDNDATPKRRGGKDQLSWISEDEPIATPGTDVQKEEEEANLQIGIAAEEDEPRWP